MLEKPYISETYNWISTPLKRNTLNKIVFLFAFTFLLCTGCDAANSSNPPTHISKLDVDELGYINDWVLPNNWIFIFNPQLGGNILNYEISSGDVTTINTPDINIFGLFKMSKTGNLFGYSQENGTIAIRDKDSNQINFEIEGDNFDYFYDDQVVVTQGNEIYLIDLLTSDKQLIQTLETKGQVDNEVIIEIAWRPGTNQVAFLRYLMDRTHDDKEIYDEIILVDIEAQSIKVLDSINDSIRELSWSPNGQFAAYAIGRYQGDYKLRIFDVENDCVIKDIPTQWPGRSIWSPDGSKIVYEDNPEIKVLDIQDYFGVEYEEMNCLN